MSRVSPDDKSFRELINRALPEPPPERILFIDTDNEVREVVYPAGFDHQALHEIRKRLAKEGVLKAVVHVNIPTIGGRHSRGPRYTLMEYLPEKRFYAMFSPGGRSIWVEPSEYPEAFQYAQTLWGEEEGGVPAST